MGGSSIGGALLTALLGDLSPVPIGINRNYSVPLWANSATLAVFTSYSGNTEETLSAFEEAGAQGAQRVAISTGGKLAERCGAENVPCHRIPPGLPPRAALPYTLVPLLQLARSVDILSLSDSQISETSGALRQLGEQERREGGRAAEIASKLVGKIPLIYTGPGLMSAVGLRWRGQLAENAKSLAFGNAYPELNHNEIVGWQSSESITSNIVVIELADMDDDEPIRKRMDLTRSLLESKAADWLTIQSEGGSRLARMMWAVLLGDWVSFRLAELKDEDPMPVELIDTLKSGLAASNGG
jgi:glucose/mannose-6-phosphate isomerase